MFFALLRKGINEELPGWPEVVVAFDGQDGSAQRKEADACYKANRPADDQALKPILALPSVKAGLDLFAITWVEITDAEADEVDRHPGDELLGARDAPVTPAVTEHEAARMARRGCSTRSPPWTSRTS